MIESDLLIRPAEPADAAAIVDFQLRMARETEDLELDRAILNRGVAAVFADPGKGAYWIAERGGRIVGCLLTTHEWSDWRDGVILWIQSVYVIPEERGRGVYRALYERRRGGRSRSPPAQGDPALRGEAQRRRAAGLRAARHEPRAL